MMSAFQIYGVTKQILFHNSVDFIGYLRQAYRVFQVSTRLYKSFYQWTWHKLQVKLV